MSGRAVVIAYAAMLLLILPAAALAPRADGFVVVVLAPWSAPDAVAAVVASAGGRIVSGTRVSFALVASGDTPEFAAALYGAGALVVLDAAGAKACL